MANTTPAYRFEYWIEERHSIYLRRQAGEAAPWTKDAILGAYRFCNVYRQLDKVTVWINNNWLQGKPVNSMPFRAVVGRLINEPDCLAAIQDVVFPWNPNKFVNVLNERKAAGLKIRNTAYIVSTNGLEMPFPEYIAEHVLTPMYLDRGELIPVPGEPLSDYAYRLHRFTGMGSFLVGQVIADLKYHHPTLHPKKVDDWYDFVVPGPGSKRGLNRLHGYPYDKAMSEATFRHLFPMARELADEVTCRNGFVRMHAQDVQNCLCEFDKYERALHGHGTPKQLYTPVKTGLFD